MKKQAYPILVLLLVMWLVRIVDVIIPADLNQLGLVPRTLEGVPGIALMPFLHGGFGHLIANTIPLAILLGLTVASRHRAWLIVAAIIIGSGTLLWLFGLIAYLITIGVREQQLASSLAVALLVGLLFGATLLSGVVPRFGSTVSWDGHLLGAVSGVLVAVGSSRRGAAAVS